MEYTKLVSVSGLPGLFELIASKSDGAILRSLDDKTTRFVSSRVHNFSHLESIEVYTEQENVNLAEVFQAMQSSGENLPNEKDASAVKKYFEKVYPTMDFDRVYASDMKKMVKWFDVLQKNNVEIKLSEEEQEAENKETEPEVKEIEMKEQDETPAVETEPKKVKAAKAKKAETAEIKEEAETNGEPMAAKKKAAKK
jgi:uncharacterized protein DUF6852/uncharacterized protein DUF5606